MINSNKPKKDKYEILDDLTKVTKQTEVKVKDKKTKKEKTEKKITIENLNEQINIDKQDPKTFNQVILLTEKDNIVHNYFHYFEMYWDAGDCMSSAIVKFPKTKKSNTKYWINYDGEISIYMGDKASLKTLKQASKTIKNAQDTYWFIDGMTPFFKGEIGQIKEKTKELEIRIDSIGKRFKQKIPEEFRQSYIYNQNVRDAFQAICEFLGVKYICPPPSINQTTETDGNENDLNQQQQQEQQTKNQAKNQDKKTTEAMSIAQNNMQNLPQNNNSNKNQSKNSLAVGVASSINKIYNQAKNNITNNINNQNNNEGQQNNNTTNQNTTSVPESTPINGYTDISFDANGAIVHGSMTIEESPDMAETLIAMEEHPLDKYLEDTKNVAKDVTALLKGHFFDTVNNGVLNYGAITIQAQNATTSTPQSTENPEDGSNDPQDTAKSMKKTKNNATEIEAARERQNAIKSKQKATAKKFNLTRKQTTWSLTAGQTSVKSPTSISK